MKIVVFIRKNCLHLKLQCFHMKCLKTNENQRFSPQTPHHSATGGGWGTLRPTSSPPPGLEHIFGLPSAGM